MRRALCAGFAASVTAAAMCRAANPSLLQRQLQDLQPQPDDLTSGAKGSVYRPIFGIGAADSEKLQEALT